MIGKKLTVVKMNNDDDIGNLKCAVPILNPMDSFGTW